MHDVGNEIIFVKLLHWHF